MLRLSRKKRAAIFPFVEKSFDVAKIYRGRG